MKTANDKAPDIAEKTKAAFVRTKTVTLEAIDKASDAAKKATGAIEEFIEKQMVPIGEQTAVPTEPSDHKETAPDPTH